MRRRTFLKTTLIASAPLILPSTVWGANERVNVALIGLGGRCRDIAKTCEGVSDLRVVSVCDCYQPRVDSCLENMGQAKGWRGYTDFREMMDKENLDGVMVETTTHARAWLACHAMAAGLDAYIEKPMCLTIAEGREMVKIARKYKRITQIGTQQRSIPLNNWASDLVKNGAIGKVKEVLAPNFVGPNRWLKNEEEPLPVGGPEGWWDVWTNQAELRSYHSGLHRGWMNWWDYDGGGETFGVTGWGAHSYDQIQRALGTDETGPVELVLEEEAKDRNTGEYKERTIGEDETGQAYYHMAKNTFGPRAKVSMTFANGTVLKLHLDGDHSPGLGAVFVGEHGTIEINRDRISSPTKELLESTDRPAPLSVPETQPHIENWVHGIKTREKCNADIEYGHRATTLCYLVNIAREAGEVGKAMMWDPAAERFTNNDRANSLLSRTRRAGYELPV